MVITYVLHSCFVVETSRAVFIFDYYIGELPAFASGKPVYFLASHGHGDHCSEKVFQLGNKWDRTYVFTRDIKHKSPYNDRILYVDENRTYELDGFVLHTFRSTDMGVAYLLELEEGNIYHGGDLNWWHWSLESTAYNKQMEEDYKSEIEKIKAKNLPIDVAFLPLDQRLEEAYDWGMKYFLEQIPVKEAFPMHFFSENFDICKKAKHENPQWQDGQCRVWEIEELGQVFEV